MDFHTPTDSYEECNSSIKKAGEIFFLCVKLFNGILMAMYAAMFAQHSLIIYVGAFGWIAYFFSELVEYFEEEERKKKTEKHFNSLKELQEEIKALKEKK
jgi:hypothetical protein